ncbi:DUF4350 domain-containing protein [Salinigranum halophilum]|uniref:DUF4350 domain-containing protein n=1 Tax=Salinigranum halophilum TaxID=2565931 RepID=UPI00115F6E09|nr:DUF4350 domain-containing protein [Salinigranum halophilum]
MRPLDDLSIPQVFLIGLVVVGLLALAFAGSTSSQAFGTFNAAWDGSSGVRTAAAETGAPVEVATETTAYDSAGSETVALVLAPTESYSRAELVRIRTFVERGGTVIIAEDVGDGGNRLLSALGADMRFDGRIVADQRHHGPTVDMPLATNVSDSPYTRDVDAIMLNRGTVLTNTTSATVAVRTSEFAYLDGDDDGEVDDNETLQTFPVVGAEPVSEGTVIAVSDPSVFINAMQSRASNAAFFTNVIGDADRILLDYSHAGSQPPVRAALLWLQRTPLALSGLGIIGVVLVTYLARTGLPTRSWYGNDEQQSVDEDSLFAYVRQEHPEWDETRAQSIIWSLVSDETSHEDEDSSVR